MITLNSNAVLPFDNEGHIFTVGPQNGSKLYMPDTNGWVIEDWKHGGNTGQRSYFKMMTTMGSQTVNSSWYYGVWYDGSSIKVQSNCSSYTDYLGLNRTIGSYPYSENYSIFLYPRSYSGSGWDNTRWGASKPNVTALQINSGQYRGISVTGTFASLQILVTIACPGTVAGLDYIKNVYFSHYYDGTYYVYSVPRIRKIENSLNDPWKVAVYNTTINMSGTNEHQFFAPIIRIEYCTSSFGQYNYYVDTKFAIQ